VVTGYIYYLFHEIRIPTELKKIVETDACVTQSGKR
jgi:hypothetical protein